MRAAVGLRVPRPPHAPGRGGAHPPSPPRFYNPSLEKVRGTRPPRRSGDGRPSPPSPPEMPQPLREIVADPACPRRSPQRPPQPVYILFVVQDQPEQVRDRQPVLVRLHQLDRIAGGDVALLGD